MPDNNLIILLAAVVTAVAAVVGSFLVYRATRKRDKTTDALTERRDTIADRDALIDTLQEDIKTLKTDMQAQKSETAELRVEVREVRNHNNALVSFIYKMLAIFRRHGITEEIDPRDVPDGIHI